MDEYFIGLNLSVKGESEEEVEEWIRNLARDLLGMEKIIGITFRVSELEDSEIE